MSSLKQKILRRMCLLTFLIIFAMSVTYYYLYAKDVRVRSQQNVAMAFEQVFDDLTNRTAAVQGKIDRFVAASFVNPVYMAQMLQTQQQAAGGEVSVMHVKKVMTYLYGLAAKAQEFAALTDTLEIVIYGKNGVMLVVSRQTDGQLQTVVYLPEVKPDAVIPVKANDRWYAALQRLEDIPFAALPPEMPLRYPTALPEQPSMAFGAVNGLLTISFLTPVADRGNVIGLAEIHLGIRQQDVERYARLSGTAVNVFVGANFSAGTLPVYRQLSLNMSNLRGAPDAQTFLAHRPEIAFSEMTADQHSYYQGTVLLGAPENVRGAITVHYPRALEEAQRKKFFLAAIWIAGLFSALAIAEAVGLSAAIVRPIATLMAGITQMEQGNLEAQVHVTTNDELQVLAEKFNSMGRELQVNIREREEKERLKKEMELAQRIQTALLPKEVKHDELEIEAKMLPADEVGGDFYDILFSKSGDLWFAIGDVSGHGVTPGLIMMMAQTIHSTMIRHLDYTPKEVVNVANYILYQNVHERLKADHFMTFVTVKYLGNGVFVHAGAHLDFIVHRQATGACELIDTDGVWLNFLEDISHITKDATFSLEIGDTLVAYTDGLTEAFNPQKEREMLDVRGFIEIIKTHVPKPTAMMRDAILKDVLAWTCGERQDDMSLMIVRRVR